MSKIPVASIQEQVKVFQKDGFEIRGGMINGEPFFVLADVCKALNIKNVSDVAKSLPNSTLDTIEVAINNRIVDVNAVNESGLYQVIFKSRKQEAIEFQDWVTSEVLPSIRKHGGYLTPQKIEEALLNPDTLIQLATTLKEEKQKRVELEQKIKSYVPKVSYANAVASTINSCSIRDWIKSVFLPRGIKQKDIFEWLDSKYTYKTKSGERRARAEYEYKNYFELVPLVTATNAGAKERFQLKITGEGQIYLSTQLQNFLSEQEAA